MATKIQFRRDTSANWTSSNPTLDQGELGLETDTSKYKDRQRFNRVELARLWHLERRGRRALRFTDVGTTPSTPTGAITMFARNAGGRLLPAWIGPSGLDSALQPFLARNKVGYWVPPGTRRQCRACLGFTAYTAIGTATARNVATTNTFTRMRTAWVCVVGNCRVTLAVLVSLWPRSRLETDRTTAGFTRSSASVSLTLRPFLVRGCLSACPPLLAHRRT